LLISGLSFERSGPPACMSALGGRPEEPDETHREVASEFVHIMN
jgi:hypothetical protein